MVLRICFCQTWVSTGQCCPGCIAWPNTCLRKNIVMVFVFQICGQITWACLCLMCSSCISFCTFHHMKVSFIIWKYSSSHENILHHLKVFFDIWKHTYFTRKYLSPSESLLHHVKKSSRSILHHLKKLFKCVHRHHLKVSIIDDSILRCMKVSVVA